MPSRRCVRAIARSPSTSIRTSTSCNNRCSTAGSGRARSCVRWATTTSRSTRSPGRRRPTCSACRSVFRTRRWCDWRRTTVPRRKCSPWRTGSFRLWAARRRCCGRPATTGRSPSRARFRQASSSAPLSSSRRVACTTAACRMKRSPSCAARTRAWPTSRSRSTSPRFRSRARRCSPVKLRGNS